MEIKGGKSYNPHDKTYNITLYISLPKSEIFKMRDDDLYVDYVDKKFDRDIKSIFRFFFNEILKSVITPKC